MEEQVYEELTGGDERERMVCAVDREGRVLSCNAAFARFLRGRRPHLQRRTLLALGLAPVCMRRLSYLASRGEGDLESELDFSIPGEERVFRAAVTPLHLGPGCAGLLLEGRAVTPQSEMGRRLEQQDKMAAVGLLTASLMHEVRRALTLVTSGADLALDSLDDPRELTRGIGAIREAGLETNRLIRELLGFARAGNAGVELVETTSLIQGAVRLTQPAAQAGGVDVTVHIDGPLPYLSGNRTQLQQVLVNLIANALDVLERGGQVELRAAPRPLATGGLCIEVADTGPGIAAAQQARIFDAFFTTKGPERGTGLGLYLCRSIVERHGGEIAVRSTLGEGSVFTLTLPAAEHSLTGALGQLRPPQRARAPVEPMARDRASGG